MITTRHNAIAKCVCGRYIISTGGGRFQVCECKESFIDQERWSGYYVRTGGPCELVEQICPASCEHRDKHEGNRVIEEFDELCSYLKSTYNIELEDAKNTDSVQTPL